MMMITKTTTAPRASATEIAAKFGDLGDRLDGLPTAARRLRVTLSVLGDILERIEERRAEIAGEIVANPIWKVEAEEFDVLLGDAHQRAQALEDELFALSDDFNRSQR
jgi:hypothetical protein